MITLRNVSYVNKKIMPVSVEQIEGLIYLLPLYFDNFKVFEKPVSFIKILLSELMSNMSNLEKTGFVEKLGDAIYNIANIEVPIFFPNDHPDARTEGLGYIWKMEDEEKKEAITLSRLFENPPSRFSGHEMEVIRFFGSSLRYWKDRNISKVFSHEVLRPHRWEYFMSFWTAIMFGKKEGIEPLIELLQFCVDSKFWLAVDFALCIISEILCTSFSDNQEVCSRCLVKMKEWVEEFEIEQPDIFYHRLKEEKPLDITFNPLSETATVQNLNKDQNANFES